MTMARVTMVVSLLVFVSAIAIGQSRRETGAPQFERMRKQDVTYWTQFHRDHEPEFPVVDQLDHVPAILFDGMLEGSSY